MSESPGSICILRLSAIGDVCHAVATVQAIRRRFPTAELTWIVGKIEATLVGDLPGIRFIVFDKAMGLRAYARLRRELPDSFDVLLHMQLSLRANIAAACIRATRRIGFPAHLAREGHGLVVNERAPMPAHPHVLEGFQAFAYALGVPAFAPTWDIPIPAAAQRWAEDAAPAGAPLFVIVAAASNSVRSWLPERYAALADHASARGFTVVITGGPAQWERELADAICRHAASSPTNLAGRSNLKQLLALLGRASLVLAPDTGPAHMAVTQGVPVIGLYAHSNPQRTGPYLWRDYVVDVYHEQFERQHGKATDARRWGTRVKGEHLMQAISVDRVRSMFDRVVAERGIARD